MWRKLPSEAQICQCRVYMWSWSAKFCDGVSHESWFLGLGGLGKIEAIGKDDNQMLSNVPAYRASRGRQGQGHLEGASPSHPHTLAIKQWNARYVSTDPDVREQGWCRYPQACDEPPWIAHQSRNGCASNWTATAPTSESGVYRQRARRKEHQFLQLQSAATTEEKLGTVLDESGCSSFPHLAAWPGRHAKRELQYGLTTRQSLRSTISTPTTEARANRNQRLVQDLACRRIMASSPADHLPHSMDPQFDDCRVQIPDPFSGLTGIFSDVGWPALHDGGGNWSLSDSFNSSIKPHESVASIQDLIWAPENFECSTANLAFGLGSNLMAPCIIIPSKPLRWSSVNSRGSERHRISTRKLPNLDK